MAPDEIIEDLLRKLTDSAEALLKLSMTDVLSALVRRLGNRALDLSSDELLLAREEALAAIKHHLNLEDSLAIGIDA